MPADMILLERGTTEELDDWFAYECGAIMPDVTSSESSLKEEELGSLWELEEAASEERSVESEDSSTTPSSRATISPLVGPSKQAVSEKDADTPKIAAKVFLVATDHSRFFSTFAFPMFIVIPFSTKITKKRPVF